MNSLTTAYDVVIVETVVDVTAPVTPGLVLESSFSITYSDDSPRQITPRTVQVRIMVLTTAKTGTVTYRETKSVSGQVVSKRLVTKVVAPRFIG